MPRHLSQGELQAVERAIRERPGMSANDIYQATGRQILNCLSNLLRVYAERDGAGVMRYYYDEEAR